MRVLLSAYDSRGGAEPLAGLAAQLRGLGTEARVSAPPDAEFAERLARAAVPDRRVAGGRAPRPQ